MAESHKALKDGALRLGLIGAGRWGRVYIETVRGIDDVVLTRLASANPASAALAGPECRTTPDWREVAEATDIDAVIVATPPALHAEMTRAAVAAGLPVLVEKPLTLDGDEAEALFDFARAEGGLVWVGHTHLFHPAYRELTERARALGRVTAIRATAGAWGPFRADTPVLWDWGSHDVALCLDLLGRLPETATAGHLDSRRTEEGTGEILRLSLHFSGDIGAEIEVGNLRTERHRRFEAYFEGGMLAYDDTVDDKLIHHPEATAPGVPLGLGRSIPFDATLPLTCAVTEFAAAIRAGARELAGLRLGADVVAVLGQCQKSLTLS